MAAGYDVEHGAFDPNHQSCQGCAIESDTASDAKDVTTPPTDVDAVPVRRRHHLDAVRAFAMLLGIVLHGALAHFDSGWGVRDTGTSDVAEYLVSIIHAFRMPLFFTISGYFTALLVFRRGTSAVISHRTRRILGPLALGAFTIVPITTLTWGWAAADPESSVWAGVISGDATAVSEAIRDGADPNEISSDDSTPSILAAIFGDVDVLESLHAGGADLAYIDPDGGTALTTAVFVGNPEAATYIANTIGLGDVLRAVPRDGEGYQWDLVDWFGSGSEIPPALADALGRTNSGSDDFAIEPWDTGLHHLWFLWQLYIIVIVYLTALLATRRIGISRLPIPISIGIAGVLATVLQARMYGIGPDTSTGIIPAWHVLAYYGVYFWLGTQLFTPEGRRGLALDRISSRGAIAVPIAMLGLFPVAIDSSVYGNNPSAVVTAVAQTAFCWTMGIGMLGLGALMFSRPRRWVRWLSDASYWMYLAHLPLVIVAQRWARSVSWPALVEIGAIVAAISIILFISYRWAIRRSPIGRLLNGPLPPAVPEMH